MDNIEEQKNLGGRPRKHNREKIFEDLIEWAKKDDSININKFCALYDPPFPVVKLSEWARENPEFRVSYDTAKAFLAFRREEWLNSECLHVKAYDLNATVYDLALKEEKRDQTDYEASLNKSSEIPTNFVVNYGLNSKQIPSPPLSTSGS